MAKWKYKNQVQKPKGQFLYFKDDEEKNLTVTDWDFSKNPAGYLFRCYVTKENGEDVDKVWTVWDFESTTKLKKKLGTKASGKKHLKVKKLLDDNTQARYDLL